MQIRTSSFSDGGFIPAEFAFGVPDPATHIAFGSNHNPEISWSDLPAGTGSLVLICHDRDVPTKPDDVNQEGRQVPADLPRADFYHWVLVDIDPERGGLGAGEFSEGVTARGKGSDPAEGMRPGLNDYTSWFAGDADMEGSYFGYDGPCPPWNDTIIHHYTFTLYALDVDRCGVEGVFGAPDVLDAIEGHVLDQDSVVGMYRINPEAR